MDWDDDFDEGKIPLVCECCFVNFLGEYGNQRCEDCSKAMDLMGIDLMDATLKPLRLKAIMETLGATPISKFPEIFTLMYEVLQEQICEMRRDK